MTKKQCKPLSGQIRQAVAESGMSQSALVRATGIKKPMMSRFVSGQRGLSMESLDALADALDLHITVGKPKTGKKAR